MVTCWNLVTLPEASRKTCLRNDAVFEHHFCVTAIQHCREAERGRGGRPPQELWRTSFVVLGSFWFSSVLRTCKFEARIFFCIQKKKGHAYIFLKMHTQTKSSESVSECASKQPCVGPIFLQNGAALRFRSGFPFVMCLWNFLETASREFFFFFCCLPFSIFGLCKALRPRPSA